MSDPLPPPYDPADPADSTSQGAPSLETVPSSPTFGDNESPATGLPSFDSETPSETLPAPNSDAPEFFASYRTPQPPPRFPNLADVGLMLLMLGAAWICAGALLLAAVQFHVFGLHSLTAAAKDARLNLAAQGLLYLMALLQWSLVFPLFWHTRFWSGIEWRFSAALHARWRIASAVGICLVLALVDAIFLPGPKNAPIDEIFRQPGVAWLLFAFGVTLAPLMEELIFRGFLLPALCTAFDWTFERIQHRPAPSPDFEGKTRWSFPAMAAGSLVSSLPFALIHAPQTGYSFGPLLLLVGVALALCWIRLSTRSLAASTAVHACYNLSLFLLMLAGTGGFRHMDNL